MTHAPGTWITEEVMKPNELRCMNGHDVTPLWIVICGKEGCTGNILADETEASPYVAQLETVNAELLEACEKLVAWDNGQEDDELYEAACIIAKQAITRATL